LSGRGHQPRILLCRDFRDGFVDVGTSITDGNTAMAAIDWPAAITALDEGGLPASGGERRALRLAASLADGIPADLRDAFTGMDTATSTEPYARCSTPRDAAMERG
jgi:hypothetical protein